MYDAAVCGNTHVTHQFKQDVIIFADLPIKFIEVMVSYWPFIIFRVFRNISFHNNGDTARIF